MSTAPTYEPIPTAVTTARVESVPSAGYWTETWRNFRRRKLSMIALAFVVLLCIVAVFAPAIAGTKPVICKYKGHIYFPCLGYFARSWENPIFFKDRFRDEYSV